MKLTGLVLGSIAASASAFLKGAEKINTAENNDVHMTRSLLSRATRIDEVGDHERHLEDAFRESYIASMSVVYYQCFNRTKTNENGDEGFKSMVHFALCPTVNCTHNGVGCMGQTWGEYLIRMDYFVDAYREAKLERDEFHCEMLRERCGCDGGNANCMNYCYEKYFAEDENGQSTGEELDWSTCAEDGNQNEEARYGECERLEYNDDDNNNGRKLGNDDGVEYSVGPYCGSDHHSIYLGVFQDEECMVMAEDGVYEWMSGGKTMPYSAKSKDTLVTSECLSCKEPTESDYANANYYNGNQNDEEDEDRVIQFCEEAFENVVSKCEDNLEELQYWQARQDDDGGEVQLRCQCDCLDTILEMEGLSKFYPGRWSNGTLFDDVLSTIDGWFANDEGYMKYVTKERAVIAVLSVVGFLGLCFLSCWCYCCCCASEDGCCYTKVADDDIVDDKKQALNPAPQDSMDDSAYVYS